MKRLPNPGRKLFYLITDGTLTSENFHSEKEKLLRFFEKAVRRKISLIQIREKKLPARLALALTKAAVRLTQKSETAVLVNDRADIALAAGADGVHLTSSAIPTEAVRRDFPEDFIIGVSTHSSAEIKIAGRQGADFATFGPVFPTPSKAEYGPVQGLEKLNRVCRELKPFPIIALGGIDRANFPVVLESEAAGLAGISFFLDEENLDLWGDRPSEREQSGK
ncbi:MAG: thiamine phosphate synthase [Pyrinomonadaceae bacterium]